MSKMVLNFNKYNYSYKSKESALSYLLYRININKNYYAVRIILNSDFSMSNNQIKNAFLNVGVANFKSLNNIKETNKNLFFNVIYNELDWFLYNQWQGMAEKFDFNVKRKFNKQGKEDLSKIYNKMRQTNLKEFYFCRYNNELIILAKNVMILSKVVNSIANKLNRYERSSFVIGDIIDLKTSYLHFIDFKIMLKFKGNRFVAFTRLDRSIVQNFYRKLRQQIIKIRRSYSNDVRRNNIYNYNYMIYKFHKEYEFVSNINLDLSKYGDSLRRVLYNSFKHDGRSGISTKKRNTCFDDIRFMKRYLRSNYTLYLGQFAFIRLDDVSFRPPKAV